MTIGTITYDAPDKAALLNPAERKLAEMEELTIDDAAMAQLVSDERGAINKALKSNEEKRLEIVRAIDKAKEPVNELFRPVTELLKRALGIADAKLLTWNDKVRREREEVERKAREEARKREAAAEAEAAKIRAQAEADARALREKAAAEEAAGNAGAAAKLAVQAENKIAAGEAKVEAVVAIVLPAAAPPAETKLVGAHEATTYSGEGHDLLATIQFVAANPMWVNLLAYNPTGVNATARSLKEAFSIPGIKLVKKVGLRSRAA